MDHPGVNRVVSHQFLKQDPMQEGITTPIEEQAVFYVHPPATRVQPASFSQHFIKAGRPRRWAVMCIIAWFLCTLLPLVPYLNSPACMEILKHSGLIPVTHWKFYVRLFLTFLWINTVRIFSTVHVKKSAFTFYPPHLSHQLVLY